MSVPRTLRYAGSLAALAAVLSATSALAFHTPVIIVTGGSGESATVTDLSSRGSEVAVTTDWNGPGGRFVMLAQSSNDGASWSHQTWSGLDFGGALKMKNVSATTASISGAHAIVIDNAQVLYGLNLAAPEMQILT